MSSSIGPIKSLAMALVFLIILSLVVGGQVLGGEQPVGDECRWVEVKVGGTPYSVCVFQVPPVREREATVVFYSPLLLLMQTPREYGIYYELQRNRIGQGSRDLVTFYAVYETADMQRAIASQLSLQPPYQLIKITATEFVAQLRIPGTNRWLTSRMAHDNSIDGFISSGLLVPLTFEVEPDDTARLRQQLYQGDLEFHFRLEYPSEVTRYRQGVADSGFEFPKALLDDIFKERETAALTGWQLHQLWMSAKEQLHIKVRIDDDGSFDRYLEVFNGWAQSLRPVTIEERLLALIPDLPIEAIAPNSNAELQHLEEEHRLILRQRQDPASLSQAERQRAAKADLYLLKRGDLLAIERNIYDFNEYLFAFSHLTYQRHSASDVYAWPALLERYKEMREVFSPIQKIQPWKGKTVSAFGGALSVGFDSKQRLLVRSSSGKPLFGIPLYGAEAVIGLEEAPEEGCLRIHIEDARLPSKSIFCLHRQNGKLIYQRYLLPRLSREAVLRQTDVKISTLGPGGKEPEFCALRGERSPRRLWLDEGFAPGVLMLRYRDEKSYSLPCWRPYE